MKKITNYDISKAKRCIFDFDGTLIPSANFWKKCDAEIIENLYGIKTPDNEVVSLFYKSKSTEEYFEKVRTKYNICLSNQEFKFAEMIMAKKFYEQLEFIPNSDKALESLKHRQMPLTLATRCPGFALDSFNNKTNFVSLYFNDIVTPKDVNGNVKKTQMYNLAFRRNDIRKTKTALAFEDDLSGIKGANEAGATVVWVNCADNGITPREQKQIEQIAEFYLDDYKTIC